MMVYTSLWTTHGGSPMATTDSDQLADLINPTDEAILDAMSDGRRWTAPYLASEVNASRKYINCRLSMLAKLGYVERVHEGLYELNE